MISKLQDDILSEIAKKMSDEIDKEFLMVTMGFQPFTFSEGKVSGARYLTVHPNNSDRWNEMMQWMIDTFGPTSHDGVWTPSMRWYANNSKFWFRNQQDLEWFILRWSD
jgi:hypothetical protein